MRKRLLENDGIAQTTNANGMMNHWYVYVILERKRQHPNDKTAKKYFKFLLNKISYVTARERESDSELAV